MDKHLIRFLEGDDPLMQSAINALKRYHEAIDAAAPEEEVERLRNEAESLFQAVSDYLLRVTGGGVGPLH
ncbi:hypothetical protein [Pseudomonas putida]|uniref:hypothetical protein n=1 Tax=Pseudomonas putida TaxID=303 RepID=UPI00300F09BA